MKANKLLVLLSLGWYAWAASVASNDMLILYSVLTDTNIKTALVELDTQVGKKIRADSRASSRLIWEIQEQRNAVLLRDNSVEDNDDVIYTDYKRSAEPSKYNLQSEAMYHYWWRLAEAEADDDDDDVIYTDYKRNAQPGKLFIIICYYSLLIWNGRCWGWRWWRCYLHGLLSAWGEEEMDNPSQSWYQGT